MTSRTAGVLFTASARARWRAVARRGAADQRRSASAPVVEGATATDMIRSPRGFRWSRAWWQRSKSRAGRPRGSRRSSSEAMVRAPSCRLSRCAICPDRRPARARRQAAIRRRVRRRAQVDGARKCGAPGASGHRFWLPRGRRPTTVWSRTNAGGLPGRPPHHVVDRPGILRQGLPRAFGALGCHVAARRSSATLPLLPEPPNFMQIAAQVPGPSPRRCSAGVARRRHGDQALERQPRASRSAASGAPPLTAPRELARRARPSVGLGLETRPRARRSPGAGSSLLPDALATTLKGASDR
jgi:hypothetical protein